MTTRRLLIFLLCGTTLGPYGGIVRAEPPEAIGAARGDVCDGDRSTALAFGISETLNDVARALSRGATLQDAVDRVGYAHASVETLYVDIPTDDATLRVIIEDHYCTAPEHRRFNEVGTYRNGRGTWIVFAVRDELPANEQSAAIAARVLELVNTARAEPRRCGRAQLAAAAPLTSSDDLTEAALHHARDMALHESFSHRGSDGSRSAERVSRAGYRWRATGENIAAGQPGPDAVVSAWLDSPGHCASIMDPQYTQMGVAFALAPGRKPAIYWAQVFGAPR